MIQCAKSRRLSIRNNSGNIECMMVVGGGGIVEGGSGVMEGVDWTEEAANCCIGGRCLT